MLFVMKKDQRIKNKMHLSLTFVFLFLRFSLFFSFLVDGKGPTLLHSRVGKRRGQEGR
jgi:hypothetical protein